MFKYTKPVTDETIEHYTRNMLAAAGDTFTSAGIVHPPVFVAARATGEGELEITQVGMFHGFETSEDKDAAAALMQQILSRDNADVLWFVNEAWVVETKDEDEARKAVEAGSLANHPKRAEAIVAVIFTKWAQYQVIARIERPEGDRPRLVVGDLQKEDETHSFSGRFALSAGRRKKGELLN